MRVRGQALPGHHLTPEVVELRFGEAALEEGARVDAGRGMALVVDLVTHARGILATEEVIEADLVQAGGGRERGEVAADARRGLVGPQHHGHGVPADQAADAPLHVLVAGKGRFLFRADGVDVARLGQRRQTDVKLAGALQQLVQHELGALGSELLGEGIEGGDPVLGLIGVGVGWQELEVTVGVEHVARIVGDIVAAACLGGGRTGVSGVSCCRHEQDR